MKSEPEEFSIDDLRALRSLGEAGKGPGDEPWSGVRNYAARNYMMRDMKVGDMVLFYHSSCEVPGVYGLAKVSRLAEPDASQFDKKSDYFDPKAKKEEPTWYGVRVKYAKTFKQPVTLAAIKADTKLKNMFLFKNGRLSVGPVTRAEYDHILKLAEAL